MYLLYYHGKLFGGLMPLERIIYLQRLSFGFCSDLSCSFNIIIILLLNRIWVKYDCVLYTWYRQSLFNNQLFNDLSKLWWTQNYDPTSKLKLLPSPIRYGNRITFWKLGNWLVFMTGCSIPWPCHHICDIFCFQQKISHLEEWVHLTTMWFTLTTIVTHITTIVKMVIKIKADPRVICLTITTICDQNSAPNCAC